MLKFWQFLLQLLGVTWVTKIFTGLGVTMGMWIFHGLIKLAPGQGRFLMEKVADVAVENPGLLAPFAQKLIQNLTGIQVSAEQLAAVDLGVGAGPAKQAFGRQWMDAILGAIVPEAGLEALQSGRFPGGAQVDDSLFPNLPEEVGQAGTERFMGTNMNFQLTSWFMTLATEVQSAGRFRSVGGLPTQINWGFGLGWLSWLILGPVFQNSTLEPMERRMNRLFRGKRPTQSQVNAYRRAGLISEADWQLWIQWLGVKDGLAQAEFIMDEARLSDSDMRDFLRRGVMTREAVVDELKRKGFSQAKAEAQATFLEKSQLFQTLDDIVAEGERLFQDQVITEDQFRTFMEAADVPADLQDLKVQLLDLRRQRRRDLTPTQWIRAWQQDLIGIGQLRQNLQRLGFTEFDADVLIDQNRPEPIAPPRAS
jgi:hypothetical protein